MPVTTGRNPREGSREAALRRDETRRDQLALLLELREVEHWRRLVAARLDLAHHTATAHAPGRYLDVYAGALRAQVRAATSELVSRLDDRRPGGPAEAERDTLAPVLPMQRGRRPRRGPDDAA